MPPGILVQVLPASLLRSHWTVGAGLPEADAEKVAELPRRTLILLGWVVMEGAKFTLRLAAEVVAEPTVLEKTARNRLP